MNFKKLMGMAFACLFSLGMSTVAFAAGETYKVTEKAEGENLVVTIDFVGADVAAGNYKFDYDTTLYSLVKVEKGSSNATMTINDTKAGMVKGNFFYVTGYDGKATDIVKITLKMLNGTYDKTKLGLSSFSLTDINSATLVDETTVKTAPSVDFTCAHNWGDGKVTKEATETAEGEKVYTCSICGETKKEAIPKKTSAKADEKKDSKSIKSPKTADSTISRGILTFMLVVSAGVTVVLRRRFRINN